MTKPTPPGLFDIVGRIDYNEATPLAALPADPVTGRLLVAWRRSVADLEAARAAAVAARDDDLVRWLDYSLEVRVSVAEGEP